MLFRRKKPPASEPAAAAPAGEAAASASVAKTQFLTGDGRVDRRTIDVLLTAIARVSQSQDIEHLLAYIVDTSIEVTGAERGILLLAGKNGELEPRMARQKGKKPAEGDLRFSTSVVRRVLSDLEPIRATVNSDSEALELGTSVFDLKLRAVMCVPLEHREGGDRIGTRGVLYVDSRAATREFKHEDLALFAALSQHISISLENAKAHLDAMERAKLEQSLEIASQIQSGLMPQIPEKVRGYDLFGWYRPAERTTGDFYDFVKTKSGRLGVVVGDVTGHGIGPALITATAQASLRSYLKVLDDPAAAVGMLNQDLEPRMDDGLFLTLFTGIFSPNGDVQVLNAGQTPPLVWRAGTKSIETIKGTAPALGMVADYEYVEGPRITLADGDILIAFTDGFVEARSSKDADQLFDEAGVRKILENGAASGQTARELTEALVQSALQFSGGVSEDDMTVVTVRKIAEPA
ncbi:MAG: PP2C family protein-serine/threonine phosphatase [Planctomycetota bacterium]